MFLNCDQKVEGLEKTHTCKVWTCKQKGHGPDLDQGLLVVRQPLHRHAAWILFHKILIHSVYLNLVYHFERLHYFFDELIIYFQKIYCIGCTVFLFHLSFWKSVLMGFSFLFWTFLHFPLKLSSIKAESCALTSRCRWINECLSCESKPPGDLVGYVQKP